MQISFLKHFLIAFCLFSTFAHGQVQVAQLSASEIEKRNAAAAFATSHQASLSILLGECSHLLGNSNMEIIAKGWFERNMPEMEAAYVWLDRYLAYLKSTDANTFQRTSNELVRATGTAALQNSRTFFARNAPDTTSCEKAAKIFSIPQLDIKNIALNPGYEQLSEFPQTLARIRNEPNFSVPQHLKLGFENSNRQLTGLGNIASLDAADALKEKGDGPGRGSIYMGMAKRGDGKAAQQVGLIYLNGQQVEKNIPAAYRWFYAAWSLSDMDGLNAMGVMLRDGLGVPVNLTIAQSAFYLAKAAARNQAAFDLASNNVSKLTGQITDDEKSKIACMSLKNLDDALRAPIQTLQPVVQGKPITNPERRLGSIVKDLTAFYQPDFCK